MTSASPHRAANSLSTARRIRAASLFAALAIFALPISTSNAAEEKTPAPATATASAGAGDEASSRKSFAVDYEAGVAAVAEKNWTLARQKFTNALKSLGDYNDLKKSTAQVLLNKAERALIKDDALYTASELMRLKQWVEAEEGFRKVVDVSGETETLRKNIMACRAGLDAESPELHAATELLKARKWKEATDAFNKASDTLGGIRVIRDGLQTAQLGAESDELLKKGPGLLKDKKWDEAFNVYKRLMQIVGETDEVKKGIAAAQVGYAEEHKTPAATVPETLGPKQ